MIAFDQHERDLVGLLRLLSLQPPESIHPMYRVKDPVVLMERLQSAERELVLPSQRLAIALRTALRAGVRPVFEKRLNGSGSNGAQGGSCLHSIVCRHEPPEPDCRGCTSPETTPCDPVTTV